MGGCAGYIPFIVPDSDRVSLKIRHDRGFVPARLLKISLGNLASHPYLTAETATPLLKREGKIASLRNRLGHP